MYLILVISLVSFTCFSVQYFVFLTIELVLNKRIKDLKQKAHTNFTAYGFSMLFIIFAFIFIHLFVKDLNTLEDNSPTSFFIFTMLINFSFIIIPFFIMPIVFRLKKLKQWDPTNFNFSNDQISKITKGRKLYLIELEDPNAFVMGILSFSQIIVITQNLFSILDNTEIESIIAHEEGHIKNKHLTKILISTIALFTFSAIIQTVFIFPLQQTSSYYGYIISSYHGISAGIITFLVGSLNKIYEKEADIFAGRVTNKIAIISALKKIDSFYDGALNKWSYNYPTLSQRIENVENNH